MGQLRPGVGGGTCSRSHSRSEAPSPLVTAALLHMLSLNEPLRPCFPKGVTRSSSPVPHPHSAPECGGIMGFLYGSPSSPFWSLKINNFNVEKWFDLVTKMTPKYKESKISKSNTINTVRNTLWLLLLLHPSPPPEPLSPAPPLLCPALCWEADLCGLYRGFFEDGLSWVWTSGRPHRSPEGRRRGWGERESGSLLPAPSLPPPGVSEWLCLP